MTYRSALVLAVLVCAGFTLPAQDRAYGRSVVATQYGIVATSQVSASQAGAHVLEQGGSAIDAAIAEATEQGDAGGELGRVLHGLTLSGGTDPGLS